MSHLRTMQSDSQIVIPAAGETFVGEDGTVSVVLEDNVDENYEPTQAEIEEFAAWMGMELPKDNEFLYIAKEGLKASLPDDWRPCRTNEDEIYYFNFKTGESTWDHPMDEFYREKFIKEKEKKKLNQTTTSHVKKNGGNVMVTVAAAAAAAAASASSNNTITSSPVIMKNPPPLSSSTTSSTTTKNTAMDSTSLQKGNPLRTSTSASNINTSTNINNASSIIGSTASPVLSPRTGLIAPDKQTSGIGERRIMSEAEINLEAKIRQEREAEFKLEEEKAKQVLQERLRELHRQHEAEIVKLRNELQLRKSSIMQEREKERGLASGLSAPTPTPTPAHDWGAALLQLRQEESKHHEELAGLRVAHEGRVTQEVGRAEAAAREQLERRRKQMETESAAAMEKLRGECRAEFMAKKEALVKKSQEELRQLREEADKKYQEEVKKMREKNVQEIKQLEEEKFKKGTGELITNDAKIAAIHAKEAKDVAAIIQKSKEEQEELRSKMEAKLSQLRKELCDLEEPVTVSLNMSSTTVSNKALEEVRQRWKIEEEKRMKELEKEREKKLSEVIEQLKSTPTLTLTSKTTGETSSSTNDEILAAKEKAQKELQEYLRNKLKEELDRAIPESNNNQLSEEYISKAVEDAIDVFIRTTELRRRLEREEFERRRDRALAEHAKAKAAYEKKVSEQKAQLAAEAATEVEEMLKEKSEAAIKEALQILKTEGEIAERQIRRRHEDECRTLIAEVDEEMRAYEQKERVDITTQEEANFKIKEEELRLKVLEVENNNANSTTNNVVNSEKVKQHIPGIPMELLQRRLNSIEKTYLEQEQKLQKELEEVKAEMGRLGELLAMQEEQKLQTSQTQQFLQQNQQQQQQEEKEEEEININHPLPERSNIPSFQINKGENIHSAPFAFEAMRFLNEQQHELSIRQGALRAAREEWHNDIRNASCAISLPSPAEQLCETTGDSAVNSQLISLVGALGDKIEHLTGKIAKIREPALIEGKIRELSPQICKSHSPRKSNSRDKPINTSNTLINLNKRSPREKSSRRSPSKQRSPIALVQKWSQILIDLATPPTQHNELSSTIQRYVTDR